MTDTALPDTALPDVDLLNSAPPQMTVDAAAGLVRLHYGLVGTLRRLTSERDLNFHLAATDGRACVVKIANPAEPHAVTNFQTEALVHIAARAPGLPVPRVIPALDGRVEVALEGGSLLRVLTYLEGMPLHLAPRSTAQRRAMGRMAAALSHALEGFAHPASGHDLLWDIKHAARLRPLLHHIADADLRALCTRCLDIFDAEVAAALPGLPWQVVHNDLNPHNVLVDPDDTDRIAGVLDFGDMVLTPRVCDLAVAASYQIDAGAPLESLEAFVGAYHRELPLTPGEVAAVFDLVAARMVTTVAITSWRAALYPENAAYILRNFASARAGLDAFANLSRKSATEALARVCGME